MKTLLYRNLRWNLPLAAYMAARGIAVLAVGPMLIVELTVRDDQTAFRLMVAAVFAGAAVPFLRTLTGGVWLENGSVVVRNPFRTRRFSRDSVERVVPVPLWQNFFVVAGVERLRGRVIRVVPVAVVDADLLLRLLEAGEGAADAAQGRRDPKRGSV